ncbi:KdsC family phosphatase [Niabella beijingensis]|uniref:KdsC family phosphatase n=1 Tax=Niabella beijingensis TaxID=2872700 RepID=UPI001CBCE684|nr:HAD hydrolase family protein [Niabella beijingensis]MBZ4191766.1 HAD hydrolase family protein [Niabella beijingensis]
MNLLQRFRRIRVFIFDVDGVLTNGDLLVLDSGEWARVMNVKDGYALQLALKLHYKIFIISGSAPSAVELRLNKLGIQTAYFGIKDKKAFVKELIEQEQLQPEEILFMGDDIPDLPVFDIVGLPACPADAASELLHKATFISGFEGGKGCVREVIEKVLRSNDQWGNESLVAST